MDSPKCFYHPHENITNICLHSQCILPLCPTCFKIHKKQHPHGEHLSRVIPFKQAKTIAISAINNEIEDLLQSKSDFDKSYNQFQNAIQAEVNKILEQTYIKLKSQQFNYDNLISQLTPKITNLQQNCLKQMIHHYEHGNIFMNTKTNFQFNIQTSQLNQTIKNMMTIKQQNVIKQQSICNSFTQNTPTSFSINHNLTTYQKQNQHSFRPNSLTNKRKNRQGIFVASSPKNTSQTLKCYSTDSKKHHESHEQYAETKYENQSLHNKIISQSHLNTPFNKSKTHKIITKTQSEKNLSQKHKNMFPEPIFIYKESNSSKRLDLSRKSESKSQQKTPKCLGDVINKINFASNSCSSKLITKKSDQILTQCLNPQQMRDLIMKKRGKTNQISTADKIIYIKTKI